jgi:hypothetical protein
MQNDDQAIYAYCHAPVQVVFFCHCFSSGFEKDDDLATWHAYCHASVVLPPYPHSYLSEWAFQATATSADFVRYTYSCSSHDQEVKDFAWNPYCRAAWSHLHICLS